MHTLGLGARPFRTQVGESYERAYTDMVRVQQLTELEEVVEFKAALEGGAGNGNPDSGLQRTAFIKQLWQDRLRGAQRHVEVRVCVCVCV